jgi:hypothetical protein
MAALVFTDADVTINSIDLSSQVRNITLNYAVELLDASAMGVGQSRDRVTGLLDWNMSIEFLQDFAAGSVDATLFPLVGAAAFACAIRPTSAVVSATNPEFQGNAFLESYPPLSGGVAELAVVTANFQGSGVLTRATT